MSKAPSAKTQGGTAETPGLFDRLKGPLALLLAAMVWGGAFVAQAIASRFIGPFTFNGCRTLLAAFFLLGIVLGREALSRRRAVSPSGPAAGLPAAGKARPRVFPKALVLAGIACGLALFCGDNLQQFGMTLYPDGVSSAGRGGFITTTYVVMVALVSWVRSRHLQPFTAVAVVLTVAGMYLLCLSGGFSDVYLGDVLVLLSAVGYTAHILVIDRYSHMDGLKLTCMQFFASGSLAFVCMVVVEHPDPATILPAVLPMLYAGIISSGVGYTMQTIGQRTTDPSVAAIIMSLESVFSAVAGWLLLDQLFTLRELAGCALVFAAVILAQVPEFLKGTGDRAVPAKN